MKLKTVIFGIGKNYIELINPYIDKRIFEIVCLWDNNREDFEGTPVSKPSSEYTDEDIYIVLTPDNSERMRLSLIELGYSPDRIKNRLWLWEKRVIAFYSDYHITDIHEKEAYELINGGGLRVYNSVLDVYVNMEITSGVDSDGDKYLLHNGKKMYFEKSISEENMLTYYRNLVVSMQEKSTHSYYRYLDDREYYDCVVDAGCCEGIFALDVVDRTERMYTIEVDPKWHKVYKKTFDESNYNCKMIHINKFLYDKNGDNEICLDTILKDYVEEENKTILIKMDIEGAEQKALLGAKRILESNNKITILACAYHHFDACETIGKLLTNYGFSIEESPRNMFFEPGNEKFTVDYPKEYENNEDINYRLRPGLIIARKDCICACG